MHDRLASTPAYSRSAAVAVTKLSRYLILILVSLLPVTSVWSAEEAEQAAEPSPEQDATADTGSTPAKIPRTTPDVDMSRLKVLAKDLGETELLWLNGQVGDPSAVMALYLPANHVRVRGGVLLVHDIGQHPDWPQGVGELRKSLTDIGWHTLSLGVQYTDDPEVPARQFPAANAAPADSPEAAPETDETTADDQVPDELESTTTIDIDAKSDSQTDGEPAQAMAAAPPAGTIDNQQRIDFGLQQLESFGLQNRILIGVGLGSEQLLNFLRDNPESVSRAQGVILINSSVGEQAFSKLKELSPGYATIKFLDIYDSTQPELAALANERRNFARRQRLNTYRTVPMAGLTMIPGGASQRLHHRIWSWIETTLPSRVRGAGAG